MENGGQNCNDGPGKDENVPNKNQSVFMNLEAFGVNEKKKKMKLMQINSINALL